MRIKEYIAERNEAAKIAYTSADAEETFLSADKGSAGKDFNVRKELKKVHDRYDAEIVDDFNDFVETNRNDKVTDAKGSLLSK